MIARLAVITGSPALQWQPDGAPDRRSTVTKTARIAEVVDPKPSQGRATLAVALGILVLAATLRLYGLSWGLPDVFEEATPLSEAWKMWGWGPSSRLDLNPHFFHYPSLAIYCQFIGQGAMYLCMRLGRVVDSSIEYAALYVADKTPFLIMGRMITLLFGMATVWLLYKVCSKIMSPFAACAASFFLAVCAFHIEKSQVVEVDVPLAFFSLLALYFLLRIAEEPSGKNYLWAGAAIGLAVSTKYTAALLFIPLVVLHFIVMRAGRDHSLSGKPRKTRPGCWRLLAAIGVALIVFFVTSPFVFIDAPTALEHLSLERLHMKEGHFGLEVSGTAWFYIKTLSEQILGWPLVILAAGGFIYRTFRRRELAAVILASFLLPYAIAIGSWTMKADRYLMPILPVIVIFAAAAMDDIVRSPRIAAAAGPWRVGTAVALLLAAAAPLALAYPQHFKHYEPDPRTLAREWIEANIPPGSFIATESHGPSLRGPHALFSLDKSTRAAALRRLGNRPRYAVQLIPMHQVYPELSAAFYDPRMYQDADIFITSSAVQSRYRREPERFRSQLEFYETLEARCRKLAEFSVPDGRKPTITIYEVAGRQAPFARRRYLRGPYPLKTSSQTSTETLFYNNLGINYESFGFLVEAISCYDLALAFETSRPSWYTTIVIEKTRCLMALGRKDEAISFVRTAAEHAPAPEVREHILRLSRSIQSGNK